MSRVVTAHLGPDGFRTEIQVGPHSLLADEPVAAGGLGAEELRSAGPKPDELVAAALGACTAITLRMYASRKGWPLTAVDVTLEVIEEGGRRSLRRRVELGGPLSDEQRQRLAQIADACPVHKMLTQATVVQTTIGPD